ncbi:MAG: hypothetical protein KDB00_07510 [Planctomycetales bacterium]|nr:hypothetical protein [Planctomycetales bacterium]
MATEITLGVDIGGANLKYADTTGRTRSVEFPLWLKPDDLAVQLASDLQSFHDVNHIAATMTGELADCFLDRAIGVDHIVDQLCRASRKRGLPEPNFYGVDGRFHSAQSARQNVDEIAASNWHALASFVADEFKSRIPDGGLLVDIGSTTSDLVPLRGGSVLTNSRTDFDRLAEGSLVYLGGDRTPVCALVHALRYRNQDVPVMREVFATMQDVRLLIGFVDADASDCRTADGKPRDAFHARNRIARMIGLDHRSVTMDEAKMLANQVHDVARAMIGNTLDRLKNTYGLAATSPIILSGHCGDLLPVGGECQVVSLVECFGVDVSRSAPAYAVARLLMQRGRAFGRATHHARDPRQITRTKAVERKYLI